MIKVLNSMQKSRPIKVLNTIRCQVCLLMQATCLSLKGNSTMRASLMWHLEGPHRLKLVRLAGVKAIHQMTTWSNTCWSSCKVWSKIKRLRSRRNEWSWMVVAKARSRFSLTHLGTLSRTDSMSLLTLYGKALNMQSKVTLEANHNLPRSRPKTMTTHSLSCTTRWLWTSSSQITRSFKVAPRSTVETKTEAGWNY